MVVGVVRLLTNDQSSNCVPEYTLPNSSTATLVYIVGGFNKGSDTSILPPEVSTEIELLSDDTFCVMMLPLDSLDRTPTVVRLLKLFTEPANPIVNVPDDVTGDADTVNPEGVFDCSDTLVTVPVGNTELTSRPL